ncbi:tRNA (guanosine(37)-N1)-methyltransferase TrmD [Curvibacter sp. CHRR-16]|uniref:tRNA (guanosine(37)-N1)-methyltransferase TrmD n=1 Tax=Curvibacter sp. CHRR-16 TaxID=2835872 RepID=UPI001BDAEC6E|nr:tRNA (guanosine(37)-N1)-methyltransferase TrmD [Curvibacter sp. CHRR-16]MBT0568702.1 tRNA (guanosine(37)-N1)-methyltransferase TrmD [Curvibacter sp. CHRR-16]
MRFDIITLFPELFAPFLQAGVTRRAYSSGQVAVQLHNPRDFADGNYRRVDDRPFGGGPGMVMMAPPLERTLQYIRALRDDGAPLVFFSPQGHVWNHALAQAWAVDARGAILLCGRYEGVDQRFIDAYVDVQVSVGDFVLSGGEIPAMAVLDSVTRLMPGVLSDEASHIQDSFNPALDGLLDCPHYTRPEEWNGRAVPEVLLSGHHEHIARWRREQSLLATAAQRPDLLHNSRAQGLLSAQDECVLREAGYNGGLN